MRLDVFKEIFWQLSEVAPVMLVGSAGVGKTSIMKQIAALKDAELSIIILSQLEATDLSGVPIVKDGEVIFSRPAILPKKSPAIVFLDEFNRAPSYTRNAVMSLVLDKEINGHKLPEDTRIVAAINPPTGEYEVEEIIDPALLSRFIWIAIEPDLEYFNRYNKLGEVAKQLLKKQTTNIQLPDLPINPRSMEYAIKIYELFQNSDVLFELLSGTIGHEGAIEFLRAVEDLVQISVEDLVKANIEKIKAASSAERIELLVNIMEDVALLEKVPATVFDAFKDEELAAVIRRIDPAVDEQNIIYLPAYTILVKKIKPRLKKIMK